MSRHSAPGPIHPEPDRQVLRILDLTLQLKELRRDQYRKVDAVKKCWFGWVSTREAMLAWVLEAVVVREGGGYQPIGLDDPKYKGRAFNRMIANASRALYEAAASGKLAWLGIHGAARAQLPHIDLGHAFCGGGQDDEEG